MNASPGAGPRHPSRHRPAGTGRLNPDPRSSWPRTAICRSPGPGKSGRTRRGPRAGPAGRPPSRRGRPLRIRVGEHGGMGGVQGQGDGLGLHHLGIGVGRGPQGLAVVSATGRGGGHGRGQAMVSGPSEDPGGHQDPPREGPAAFGHAHAGDPRGQRAGPIAATGACPARRGGPGAGAGRRRGSGQVRGGMDVESVGGTRVPPVLSVRSRSRRMAGRAVSRAGSRKAAGA
jgi:hypothetical protein